MEADVSREGLSDAEKRFLEFQWSKSQEWLLYLSNLYPTPPVKSMLKWKKKWYNKNIDSNLSVDSKVGEPVHSSSCNTERPNHVSSPNYGGTTTHNYGNKRSLYFGQTVFLLRLLSVAASIYYVTPFAKRSLFKVVIWTYVITNAAALISKFGTPKLDKTWLQCVGSDDATVCIFLCLGSLASSDNWASFISPSMTAAIGMAEVYQSIINPYISSSINKTLNLSRASNYVNNNRYYIMQIRADIEVMIGICLLLLLIMRKTMLIGVLLYWNALKTAYQCNGFTRSTFSKLDASIAGYLNKPFVPRILWTVYNKVSYYLHMYASPRTI